VPRAKHRKPPGPFPPFQQIRRSEFRFRGDQRHELSKLLPCKLAELQISPEDAIKEKFPQNVKTIADWVMHQTEEEINSYLTGSPIISGKPINAADNRTAITQLRIALKPFVRGWVDDETADIIDWISLDAKLAERDAEIAQLRLRPSKQRILGMLCQRIEVRVRLFADANGETVSEQNMLRYVDTALSFARIKHPSLAKHRTRLAALVFPSD
jgi:hypothetical protein